MSGRTTSATQAWSLQSCAFRIQSVELNRCLLWVLYWDWGDSASVGRRLRSAVVGSRPVARVPTYSTSHRNLLLERLAALACTPHLRANDRDHLPALDRARGPLQAGAPLGRRWHGDRLPRGESQAQAQRGVEGLEPALAAVLGAERFVQESRPPRTSSARTTWQRTKEAKK